VNGRQRILAALAGERPDRVPVMLHNFMMAARENGVSMERFRRSGRAVAESFIRAVETYGYDGVVVDLDTAMLAGAAGCPVDFPEDQPARCRGPLLGSLEEVRGLGPVDVGGYFEIQAALEAVSILKGYFKDEVAVRGNCDQDPFSLAALLRSPEAWLVDLVEGEEALVVALLEYAEGITGEFLRLMAGAGADILSNGDSAAGPELISPKMYDRFARPFEERIAAKAHKLGLPYILHICGRTDPILPSMAATGANGLEVDQRTDACLARDVFKGRVTFVGNIDPSGVLALGDPALVVGRTMELLQTFEATPRFILNAGCAIPAETPSDNLTAMIAAARSFGRPGIPS
jgi:MtaA/CmuA family methyltransferase